MFYGEYEHSLDQKGRLIVPSKLREILRGRGIDKLFITRGLDKCLFVYTPEEWKLQEDKFKQMPFTRQEARKFNRMFFSGACELGFDKQGRILIPQYLKDYAEVKDQVMVAGVSDRIEIWALGRWQSYFDDSMGSFEDVAEKLL